MLEAVIFDWDGVVIDSSRPHRLSWERLAGERGLPLPSDHFERGFGKKNQTIIPEIYQWTSDPEEIEALGNAKEALYRAILEEEGLDPLPGAIRLFHELKEAGVPMAVGTSTPHANVDCVIRLIGAEGFFEAVIAAEDVDRGKPDPDVFLKGADRLRAAPENCVVFEDSAHGIEAALAGGMKAVCLTTTHPREHFRAHSPTCFVRDLSEVDVPFLQRLWNHNV